MTSDTPDLSSHPGLQSELAYWDRELSLQGDYPRAILGRLLPERMADEFPFYIMPFIEELHRQHARVPRVLDVGSGPLSMLAYGAHHGFMEVVAADPLAEPYRQLLAKHGYTPTVPLVPCCGERLSDTFGTDAFDMVWIHNALDHCQSPDLVLRECVAVLRPGGYLIFQGWSREGTAEIWVGSTGTTSTNTTGLTTTTRLRIFGGVCGDIKYDGTDMRRSSAVGCGGPDQ